MKLKTRIESIQHLLIIIILIAWMIIGNVKTLKADDTQKPDSTNTVKLKEEIFIGVTHMPKFPGGEKAMKKFIQSNLEYPASAAERNIKGEVFVRCVIDKEGNVTNTVIDKSLDSICDQEAIRVIESMPKWEPGRINKKITVSVYQYFSIEFHPKYNNKTSKREIPKTPPKFPGGDVKLSNFIQKNLKMPANHRELKMKGQVIVLFSVDTEGNICDPKIIKSLAPEYDNEVLKMVALMPKWKPATAGGENVSENIAIPINFN